METKFFRRSFLYAFLAIGATFTGCSDDEFADVDGLEPTLELATDHVRTLGGYEFRLAGTITDKDGIRSIRLSCPELNLDRTIDLFQYYSEVQYEYTLDYAFTVPEDLDGDNFNLKVTVSDVGGRTTEGIILITMDGDYEDPIITNPSGEPIVVVICEGVLSPQSLTISATDNKALDSLSINVEGYGKFMAYPTESDPRAINYSLDLSNLPVENKDYQTTIIAYDTLLRTDTVSCVISVTDSPDYEKMYLADVATEEELTSDVFGVPMLIDHTGAFQYSARYYNRNAGTEISFIPQKDSFGPTRYGLDSADKSKLSKEADAEPIVLEESNVYYQIDFNIATLTYTMKTYSVNEADDPWPSSMVYGEPTLDKWNDGGSTWMDFTFGMTSTNPTEVNPFVQDGNNPHLFTYDDPIYLRANEQMHFIIHNYHTDQWWDFVSWRSDSATDPEVFGYSTKSAFRNRSYSGPTTGEDIWSEPVVKETGNYQFYFDSHLGRAKLVRVE